MLLEFEQVYYTYSGSQQPAIANLTLTIPAGKRCALIGQNGCGKTTLFLLTNGLYKPQRGTIRWQGKPLRYDRASLIHLRQQVGLVFQDPEQQLVASTVEEDISYGLCNLRLPDAEVRERVRQTLRSFELTTLAEKPVHHLSLGQKKRVSIADVMVLQPTLLLLDEPTAYLDPRHTRNLIAILQQIQAAGTTILMATHDLDFVYRWADWVFVMNQGRLVLQGSPQEVFTQHQVLENLELGIPVMLELLDKICEVLNAKKSASGNPFFTQREYLQRQILQSFRW
ncbi:MAG: ABC transporter ATP-binding protein [Chroococcidiopsidaceae cyanobacterium CP_BM_RX_35]|nr:ABC transporter ATP-binding protein [Chroococcidiopsidaceae cyanobacterium CP_BM_RX_35]